ncbi:hypothetical protein HMI55_006708 [Coelomomyces lativittatus]|nr:hypothetical protein HMI55_006708 [Coelomomyces lativittatus]
MKCSDVKIDGPSVGKVTGFPLIVANIQMSNTYLGFFSGDSEYAFLFKKKPELILSVDGKKIELNNELFRETKHLKKNDPLFAEFKKAISSTTKNEPPKIEAPSPPIKDEKPEDDTKKPKDETKKPEDDTKNPKEETKKPEDEIEKPEDENEKPKDENEKPEDETEKPWGGTRKPGGGTRKPGGGFNFASVAMEFSKFLSSLFKNLKPT